MDQFATVQTTKGTKEIRETKMPSWHQIDSFANAISQRHHLRGNLLDAIFLARSGFGKRLESKKRRYEIWVVSQFEKEASQAGTGCRLEQILRFAQGLCCL